MLLTPMISTISTAMPYLQNQQQAAQLLQKPTNLSADVQQTGMKAEWQATCCTALAKLGYQECSPQQP